MLSPKSLHGDDYIKEWANQSQGHINHLGEVGASEGNERISIYYAERQEEADCF
jgi:hypothetical protein